MISFRKLPNDKWGLSSPHPLRPGEQVEVTKRDGSAQLVTVGASMGTSNGFKYVSHLYTVAPKPASASRQNIGDLTGILKLFDSAKQHLKAPAIVLRADDLLLRVNVAGESARVPGSLTVVDARNKDFQGRNVWLGRILRDGTYEPSRASSPSIAQALKIFAQEPARIAADYGKLTGFCCFCRHRLGQGDDKRSVEVGYGPDCAKHFGLPWGE